MKKYALFLAVLAISISGCGQNSQKEEDSKKNAEMIFEDNEHSFGTIAYSGDGSYEFVFKNTGKAPLIIKKVNSSCGCTVPEWDKEPIKPRGKGKIKVKYDTKRIGSFRKTITVYSNAVNSPVKLTISGEVKKEE